MDSNIRESTEDEENMDDYYDYLPADHPLYKRLQGALEDQLKTEEESLRLLHKEKSEELKKTKRLREDIGVGLYNNQQQYAKLQETFDDKMNKLKILESQRYEIETALKRIDDVFKSKTASVKEQEKMGIQASEELNQLNRMLKYVSDYNQQIYSEIQVTTTVAYQVENKTKMVEEAKVKQDFLIDHLLGQIASQTETKHLYESQLKLQQIETQEARGYLVEANREIDDIQERKRSLLKDWDKSVVSMRTRDKALQEVRENIVEQEGEKLKYRSQNHRYKELIQKEIYSHNEITMQLSLTSLKQKNIENNIKSLKEQTGKLTDKQALLNNTTNKTKDEIKQLESISSKIRNEIELIDKNKLKLFDEARKLQEKNIVTLSTKETHEKQTENLMKLNLKLGKDIFDLQVDIDTKLNETSRVEIDKLNVETQNDALKKKINLMNNEITRLEKEYSKKESDIKKNHEDLEKKQLKVDHLNKRFGEITKNKGNEDEGLFEIKIKELNSEKENLNKTIQESERLWITKKEALVKNENLLNKVRDECTDGRSKKTILDHKKIRLNNVCDQHEKEIREIEINLKNLRYDMNKYNGLLDKNIVTKDNLSHKFFDVEINFGDKLKQMENESTRLEIEIEVLREEKADTLTQIIEVERQIYLWERKIMLEEQMQQIIKPDKGLKDIDDMKSNIHRQELVYNGLKKKQEEIIKNMEMAIQRRDYIKIRYPAMQENVTKKKSGMIMPSGNINRDLLKLKEDLRFIKHEKTKQYSMLEHKRNEWDETRKALSQVENENRDYQKEYGDTENQFYGLKLKKNSLLCQIIQNQKNSALLEDFMAKRLTIRKQDDINRELYEYKGKNEQTLQILKNIRDIYPMYSRIIDNAIDI